VAIIAQTDSMILVREYVHSVVQTAPLVLISQPASPVDFQAAHKPINIQTITAMQFVQMATMEALQIVKKYVFYAIILVMDAH
jgi:hypothetical protein